MFNKIELIKNVKSFAINNLENLLIADSNKLYNNADNKIILNSDVILQEVHTNDDYFYVNDIYGKGYYINLNREIVNFGELIITVIYPYILSAKRIEDIKNIFIRNINNHNEVFEILTSSTIYLISSNKLFKKNFDLNLIETYNFPTSEKLWQLALSQLGKFQTEFDGEKDYEVKQFVGVYNDILWVFLNSSEFIGLDIGTGEIVHRLKDVKKENVTGEIDEYLDEKDTFIFFDTTYLLDINSGKIIGLKADRYYEINLKANVIGSIMLGLWTKMKNVGIDKNDTCNKIVLKENHLYFYNIHKLKFAIFDIDTKQIIYVSEKLTNDQTKRREIKDLQVANNKVYVLDSTGDLYIFEKEKLN